MYNNKFVVIDNFIQYVNKNIYFWDIYLFIERIKNITTIKSANLFRNNLYTCLRDNVLVWYIEVLIEEQKRLVKLGNNINK